VQENVVSAYYNLMRSQLLLKVAEEAESVAREQLERTQALYELGSAARSDVLKSQVQHGNTRLDLVRARNNERQSHVDLEYTMNLTTSVEFDIDTTVIQIGSDQVEFETERARALAERENLLSLRHREQAADRRVWAARGALLPTLDFQYSWSRSRSTSAFRFGAAENANRQWSFFANWNVWDRYQNYASIAQARASARQSEFSRRQAELDAIREVRQLVNSLGEARERLAVARENVARSREDLRLAQEKFRVGAGTILDTITAESDLTSTRANEVQAVVDFLIARANLARATGRDFSEL
jgi:outer membrane protein TolC